MKKYFIIIIIAISLFSCRKDKDISTSVDNEYPTELYINTSVKGIIFGNRETPIADAKIEIGQYTQQTDLNGYFYLKDIKANKNGATIKVSKEGYNTVTKTFYPELNATTFLRITLKPGHGATLIKSNSDNKNFASASAFINITKNGFTQNGNKFTGDLMIKPYWTIIGDEDFDSKQIGHQVGYDKYFKLKGLKSYGIVGIDINDKYGIPVELDDNNTIELHLIFEKGRQIPENLPEKIPLWNFDSKKGKWLQKGNAYYDSANRYYTADVKKSGYWNFATPFEVEESNFTVQSSNNVALPYLKTKLFAEKYNYSLSLRSNSNGNVYCYLPKNIDSKIEISLENKILTKTINSSNTNIAIPVNSKTIELTGKFFDCNNEAIKNGYVSVLTKRDSVFYSINKDGILNETIIVNENENNILWFATDLINKVNTSQNITKVEDKIDLVDITICNERYAILEYGKNTYNLELESIDHEAYSILSLVFKNDDFTFELSYSDFKGIGNYTMPTEFIYSLINKDGTKTNNIFPLDHPNQKIDISTYAEPGMLRGHIEGITKKNFTGTDSTLLKFDYLIYIE